MHQAWLYWDKAGRGMTEAPRAWVVAMPHPSAQLLHFWPYLISHIAKSRDVGIEKSVSHHDLTALSSGIQ